MVKTKRTFPSAQQISAFPLNSYVKKRKQQNVYAIAIVRYICKALIPAYRPSPVRVYCRYHPAYPGKELPACPLLRLVLKSNAGRAAQAIKKVWEVDPLICPHCQAEMKILSFIVERKVIRKILTHLKLWPGNDIRGSPFGPYKLKPLPSPSQHKRHYKPVDDGWPGYEEPVYNTD